MSVKMNILLFSLYSGCRTVIRGATLTWVYCSGLVESFRGSCLKIILRVYQTRYTAKQRVSFWVCWRLIEM